MKRMKCFWLIAAVVTLTAWEAQASQTGIVAWGDNTHGQTTIPAGLTNVVAIAQGGLHVLGLNGDGTVFAWGDNYIIYTAHRQLLREKPLRQ